VNSSSAVDAHTVLLLHLERIQLLQRLPQQGNSSQRPAHGRATARGRFLPLVAALLLTAPLPAARAQSTFGGIRGTAQDNSDAVVPGAAIVLSSLDENLEHTVTSGSSGEYVFENLQRGHYKIEIHANGFADAMVPSATLEARQRLQALRADSQ
jgi:hypothetical protein